MPCCGPSVIRAYPTGTSFVPLEGGANSSGIQPLTVDSHSLPPDEQANIEMRAKMESSVTKWVLREGMPPVFNGVMYMTFDALRLARGNDTSFAYLDVRIRDDYLPEGHYVEIKGKSTHVSYGLKTNGSRFQVDAEDFDGSFMENVGR